MLAHQGQVVDLANLQFIHLQVPSYIDKRGLTNYSLGGYTLSPGTIATKGFGVQKLAIYRAQKSARSLPLVC